MTATVISFLITAASALTFPSETCNSGLCRNIDCHNRHYTSWHSSPDAIQHCDATIQHCARTSDIADAPIWIENQHLVTGHNGPTSGTAYASLWIETAENAVPAENYVWNWRDAIVLKAMIDIFNDIHEDCTESKTEVMEWIETAMQSSIPKAHGRHPNGVASGTGLAFLSKAIRDYCSESHTDTTEGFCMKVNKFRTADISEKTIYQNEAEQIYAQYCDIPRYEGASSHRPGRIELWDDSVYMLSIFLLEMYKSTDDEKYLDDCIREIMSHAAMLRDSKSGLWWHGWASTKTINDDGCCECGWNANPSQRNSEFWGRGNGWTAMAMADLLSVMPQSHSEYKTILRWYRQMMDTLCRLQNKDSGHWLQLPARIKDKSKDKGWMKGNGKAKDKGETHCIDGTEDNGRTESVNFIESSCTAMFGYALAKGLSSGLIKGGKYVRAVELAHNGLWKYSLKISPSVAGAAGVIAMSNICSGTCIGEKEYYYSRDITENEDFAIGALLLFENRYHHLSDKQKNKQ